MSPAGDQPTIGARTRFVRALLVSAIMGCSAAVLFWLIAGPVSAIAQVRLGMTPAELGAFAVRQGWRAEVNERTATVTIEVGIEQARIEMLGCDVNGACGFGIIRRVSFHSVDPAEDRCGFWHWNQETIGATGFGPDYITLQRYVHFRGVTDQYLREVIQMWIVASASFWKLVAECATPAPTPNNR